MFDLLIRNCLIVNAGQRPYPGSVGIVGEKIAAILEAHTPLTARVEIDGQGRALFPGAIDPHVHYRYDRGYQDGNSDYSTETRSALHGGITTAIRMQRELTPYHQSIPAELALMAPQTHIDMAFHLAIMTEEQLATFPQYADQYGINSFKLYLAYKGKAGKLQGLQGADDGFLYDAMQQIGRYPNGVALVHCENSEIAERLGDQLRASGRADLRAWTEARPGWAEGEAIQRTGYIAYHAECPLYVVHISSAEGIEAVIHLRQRGMPAYAEVCMHHLTMTVEEAEDRFGALAKVNPPLRPERDVNALWDAVAQGIIDTVATDHVAHTTAKVKDSLWAVMPGFAGSGTMLPALITEGYHKRGIALERIAALASGNAARIFHLSNKGAIVVGADADLTLVDLNLERAVHAPDLLSNADHSMLEGRVLKGWPVTVILRGQLAVQDEQIMIPAGCGQFVPRYSA
ncbi:MAG: dihydroorotase family protein [Anaerolineae bacterium]|nr:dihydroorotase family protein [Anaerolineae bacterium]